MCSKMKPNVDIALEVNEKMIISLQVLTSVHLNDLQITFL